MSMNMIRTGKVMRTRYPRRSLWGIATPPLPVLLAMGMVVISGCTVGTITTGCQPITNSNLNGTWRGEDVLLIIGHEEINACHTDQI